MTNGQTVAPRDRPDGPVRMRVAEHPRPGHTLLHLSDTHLLGGDRRLYGRLDPAARLSTLLERVEASQGRPDAIVITGDLADHGEPEAYRRLRQLIEPTAERLGAQVIWVMGNHDDRAAFRSVLLRERPTTSPVDRVHDVRGLRIIAVDSTVPGQHHGAISAEQLRWLTEQLATPAEHGTILAMHHPPLPSVLDLAVLVELRDQSALAEVLAGSDVRGIVAGHLHHSSTGTFAGIPVSVASASCYTQDLAVPAGGTRPWDAAQTFNLVQVYPTTVVHSVVPVETANALEWVDAAETRRRLAAAGVRIPDPVSATVPAMA